MPICRHQIRGEFGLADPELYRAADRDDPEAVLEGVAMAGLVGVLRQLGDLAEFAAEIFHDLHEEVMATAARGHGLMLRVQQLEQELPSMENAFLSDNSQLLSASTVGFEWHANLRLEQSLVATGDLPRFIMDSYEECRGPPRLFLLDKFDVAGAGACLKRYSDPSFFKTEFSSSGTVKADVRREKKVRNFKTKGLFYNGGSTSDFISSTEFSSMLQDGMFNESSNVSGKNTFHLVKLKRRNFIDSSFNLRNKKLYMEQIFKVRSPELKPVYEKSLVYSSLGAANIDSNEAHDEIYENSIMDLGTKEIPVELTDKSTSTEYNHELVRRNSLNDPIDSAYDVRKEEKISSLPEESPKIVINDGYSSDSSISGIDNFMDALATMDSELETSLQNRLQHEKSLLSIPSRALDSDSNDDQTELRGLSSDSFSAGSSSVSYEWKEPLKNKASSHSASDTASSVDELFSSEENLSRLNIPCDNPSSLPVSSHHDKHTTGVEISDEASLRAFQANNASEHVDQIVVSHQTLSYSGENHTSDASPFPVESQHSGLEVPNETSSYANRKSNHSDELLVSQVSSNLIEDHKSDSSPCAGEDNERIFVGSQTQSGLSSGFSITVEDAQTSGLVEITDSSKFSTLEENAGDNQNSQKSYETNAGDELVRDLNHSDYFVKKLVENSQPMESAVSQKKTISLCSPENDNEDSVDIGLFEKKDMTHFPKEQFMNIGGGNKMILVGEQEDCFEPGLTFCLKREGEHSSQVLTDKCEFEVEVPSNLSAPSLPSMSSSVNDTRKEFLGEGNSDPQQSEITKVSTPDLISSSYLHEVDPIKTDFLDGTENESKVEGAVDPVLKKNGQDSPVVDQPLSGSVKMADSFVLASNSGFTDQSRFLIPESNFYSLHTSEAQQKTESFQHTCPSTSDASDTSNKSKSESEELMFATSLSVLTKTLSEQESARENSESAVGSRLEYLCEDREKEDLSERTVEIAKAESYNHVSQKPSDLLSSMQFAKNVFQASDVDRGHLGYMDEACGQNHESANGRHMIGSEDVQVVRHLLAENDQLSESHLSHTEKLGQIHRMQISDEMYLDKVDNANPSEYSSQSMKQTSKEGNSSGLLADDNNYGAQTVQQLSETVPAQFVEPSMEKVSGKLHQHSRGEPCERIDSNSRGNLDVPSTSGHPSPSFDPVFSSAAAFPGVGLLQSTNSTSPRRDTMPPLPPLPPRQWISGKFPQVPLSMGFSSPLNASENSRPQVSQAFSDTKSLLTSSNVEDQIFKEAPNPQRLVMESRIAEHDSSGMEEHTSIAIDHSPGHEEPKDGPNHVAEQDAPGVLTKQTRANDDSQPNLVAPKENVGPSLNAFTSVWIEENERPVSRMVIPRHKDDPLIEAVAAHDRSKLRKVSELVRSETKPKADDRNSFLEQIRNKSFNLKPAASARPSIRGPKTNLNVVAILEKANAIRQAFAGSDDEDDDADTWSDN